MAFLSSDEGKTWHDSLIIDSRTDISYPTGFQSPDGYIYISYDYKRTQKGEVMMAKFNEEDILAEKLVSEKGQLGMLISKPGKVTKSAANVNSDKKKKEVRQMVAFQTGTETWTL
jgi:sialidase-1